MPGWKNRGGGKRDPDRIARAVQADDRRRDRRAKTAHQAQEAERNALALGLMADQIVGPDGGPETPDTNPIPKDGPARDSV
jgi:hypothetical protein